MEWFINMLVDSGVPQYEASVTACVVAGMIVLFILSTFRYVLIKK